MEDFIRQASAEAGMSAEQVRALLSEAEYKQSIVDAISRPAEGKPWYEYRPIFMTDQRLEEGLEFWRANEALIDRVAERYEVDPQVIVALAVTREGIPVRSWIFPGDTPDVTTVRKIKDDLRDMRLGRTLFVGDAGLYSKANLEALAKGAGKS